MKFQADFFNKSVFHVLLLIVGLSSLPFQNIHSAALPTNGSDVQEKSLKNVIEIGLYSNHGKIYTLNMLVGKYMVDMRGRIDTGIADTWFASDYCEGGTNICGTRKFECTEENGCTKTDPNAFVTRSGMKQMDIHMRKGYVRATVVTVDVKFRPYSEECMQTTVGMLNYSLNVFHQHSPFDGMLGLGRPDNLEVWDAGKPKETPFQKLLDCLGNPPLFYVYMRQFSGVLSLGYPDPTLYHQPFLEIPVIGDIEWGFKAEKITLGDYSAGRSQEVILDTGSPVIMIPAQYWEWIKQQLGAEEDIWTGYLLVKCPTLTHQYPPFIFTVGRHQFTLGQFYYIGKKPFQPGMCRLFLGKNRGYSWILGVEWFKKYYTGFDFRSKTIKVALAK